ncbi:MAG: hypothetical protein MJZ45_04390 [Bacteroidales bacterium]|nr:hypothetical protein [Bacteroidales bacterium]
MNPFKFGTIVQDDFFTDRKNELAELCHKLDSENHVVLISPRRFGKSSLVFKALSQMDRPQICLDLQYVMSVGNFSEQLLRAIFKLYPFEKIKHLFSHFRVAPTLSTNAVTGALDVSFQPVANSQILLEDAMNLLQKVAQQSEQRMIVVLDEFQEVVKIQDGFDKQLRSLMQRQQGVNYILLGSQESMMEEIFEKKKSPFYHFGQIMRLNKIPYQDFYDYIYLRLPDIDETAKGQIADNILQFTQCHPYYTQQLASQVWELIVYRGVIDHVVDSAIEALQCLHDLDFERLWLTQNRTDRATLKRLAACLPASAQQPSSTVQSSLKRLVRQGYVVRTEVYAIEDPFFRRWILSKIN